MGADALRRTHEHPPFRRLPATRHRGEVEHVMTVGLERWLAPADAVDLAALQGLPAPVLDIGCGPGRVVEALTAAGTVSLGIDIAAAAIDLARDRGVVAVHQDVFGPVPLEGGWASAVLLDGNIGIGGDPTRLLTRVGDILRPGGRVLVETHEQDQADDSLLVRFWLDGRPTGPALRWALVGQVALRRIAPQAGFAALDFWRDAGRSFALLESAPRGN